MTVALNVEDARHGMSLSGPWSSVLEVAGVWAPCWGFLAVAGGRGAGGKAVLVPRAFEV